MIEIPEAKVIANQLNSELSGKIINYGEAVLRRMMRMMKRRPMTARRTRAAMGRRTYFHVIGSSSHSGTSAHSHQSSSSQVRQC